MKRDRVAEVENSKLVKNGEIALTVTYDIKNCSISQTRGRQNNKANIAK